MEGKYESSEDPHPLCPWPARNYSCSFCKREFRSAQALGGHMNVHRRDKARLRSTLPSWLNSHECPKPNPNPSLGSSSSSSSPSPLASENFPYTHHSQIFSPSLSTSKEKKPITSSHQISLLNPQSRDVNKSKKTVKSGYGVENLMGFADQEQQQQEASYKNDNGVENLMGFADQEQQQQEASYKNDNGITLELGIGLLKHPKEKKIDLELRLGNF